MANETGERGAAAVIVAKEDTMVDISVFYCKGPDFTLASKLRKMQTKYDPFSRLQLYLQVNL